MNDSQMNHPEIHTLLQVEPGDVTTLVDVGVEIEGVIRNKSGRALLISGRVIGSIDSQGPVIINQGAEVVGSVNAKSLQLAGRVTRRGPDDCLNIAGPLVVAKTAYMGCDAECEGVQLEYGATIDGAIRPKPRREDTNPGHLRKVQTLHSTPSNPLTVPDQNAAFSTEVLA